LAAELDGLAALVTGSSRGIGREVALAFASAGARVVVNGSPDRESRAASRKRAKTSSLGRSAAAEAVAHEIVARGGVAVACAASVADFAAAGALVDRCVAEFGRIDVLANCAGVPEPDGASIFDFSERDFRAVLDVHLGGTFHCCRHAAPRMAAQRSGAIINTSSHSSLGSYAGVAYPAAKGGVNSLTFALATELREFGVRVNAVCPGAKTRLSTGPAYERKIRDLHARGILTDAVRDVSLDPPEPRYAAPIYVFLASDRSRGVSGRVFSASGGYVGVFAQGAEKLLAYRDHRGAAPFEVDEIAAAVAERGLD
jgi:NAD(P)-dependent dehydrogenase (short-subunit alcohol dehydrogenase family)